MSTVQASGGTVLQAVAVDPTSTNVVWAGGSNDSLYSSTNGGGTWTRVSNLSIRGVSRLVFDSGTLYVSENDRTFDQWGTANYGIVKTSDRGATWSLIKIGGNSFAVRGLDARNGVVYAGGDLKLDAFLWRIDTKRRRVGVQVRHLTSAAASTTSAAAAIDTSGNPVVAIETDSADLPATFTRPVTRSFLARVGRRHKSRRLELPGDASIVFVRRPSVAVDSANNAYVASGLFGANANAGARIDQMSLSGEDTASFTIHASHSGVGEPNDFPAGLAAGPTAGDVFVAGTTNSTDFPTTPNAPQPQYASGASDAFASKVSFGGSTPPPPPGQNLALNRPAGRPRTSPAELPAPSPDGDGTTRWSSQFSDTEDLPSTSASG